MKKYSMLFLLTLVMLVGCATKQNAEPGLSIAAVQREIKVGMSSADVIDVLGSPNLVSTDSERREVWVYDKVSTENVSSSSSGGLFLLIIGTSSSSSASSSSQKTLTIIIKFDKDGLVRDFSYRQSSF